MITTTIILTALVVAVIVAAIVTSIRLESVQKELRAQGVVLKALGDALEQNSKCIHLLEGFNTSAADAIGERLREILGCVKGGSERKDAEGGGR